MLHAGDQKYPWANNRKPPSFFEFTLGKGLASLRKSCERANCVDYEGTLGVAIPVGMGGKAAAR